MTDNQTNYLTMGKTTMSFMDNFSTLWNTNAIIFGLVTNIKGSIASIEAKAIIQDLNSTGATDTQKTLWEDAAQKALHLCTGLKGYYLINNDETMYKEVDFTISDFLKCKKADALTRMNTVHNTAAGIPIATLAPYSIIASDITDLTTAIAKFDASETVKRNMVSDAKDATTDIAEYFAAMRIDFKKLDLMVDTMNVAQPEFCRTYHYNREIIDLGKGHVTAEMNLQPQEVETAFGNKFKAGYSFTVRNHSNGEVFAGLTTMENPPPIPPIPPIPTPEYPLVIIPGNSEMVLDIPSDAVGISNHYLGIYNPNEFDDAHVTLIMAKGKSQSNAPHSELSGAVKGV